MNLALYYEFIFKGLMFLTALYLIGSIRAYYEEKQKQKTMREAMND